MQSTLTNKNPCCCKSSDDLAASAGFCSLLTTKYYPFQFALTNVFTFYPILLFSLYIWLLQSLGCHLLPMPKRRHKDKNIHTPHWQPAIQYHQNFLHCASAQKDSHHICNVLTPISLYIFFLILCLTLKMFYNYKVYMDQNMWWGHQKSHNPTSLRLLGVLQTYVFCNMFLLGSELSLT